MIHQNNIIIDTITPNSGYTGNKRGIDLLPQNNAAGVVVRGAKISQLPQCQPTDFDRFFIGFFPFMSAALKKRKQAGRSE